MGDRGKEINPIMRARICEFQSINYWGNKLINNKHPKHYKSGIMAYKSRSLPRTGTPPRISQVQKQDLYYFTKEETHNKVRELA